MSSLSLTEPHILLIYYRHKRSNRQSCILSRRWALVFLLCFCFCFYLTKSNNKFITFCLLFSNCFLLVPSTILSLCLSSSWRKSHNRSALPPFSQELWTGPAFGARPARSVLDKTFSHPVDVPQWIRPNTLQTVARTFWRWTCSIVCARPNQGRTRGRARPLQGERGRLQLPGKVHSTLVRFFDISLLKLDSTRADSRKPKIFWLI